MLRIDRVKVERSRDGLGLGTGRPRLCWRVETDIRDWRQAAYEVELYDGSGQLVGSTGRVESGESVWVAWPFEALGSRQRAGVRVRVWGEDGSESDWSDLQWLEVGLLARDDWQGAFITPDWEEDTSVANPCPYLRKTFSLPGGVRRARLYVTGLGVYEVELNGQRVGDHVLSPGWTSYRHRLLYETFDVTGLLREGDNCLGAILGDGWYRGRLGFGGGRRNLYGERLALLAQLEVELEDGSRQVVVTDGSWRAHRGPILESGIYDGEVYDARLEMPGWSTPEYDDSEWAGTRELGWPTESLEPLEVPARRTQEVAPREILRSFSGKTIVDFGQNLVGRVRLRVSGPRGQRVRLRHAEVLEGGELCTRTLRTARATDEYVLRGDGEEEWEPRFTFHGFRYVEVEGWPGELRAEDLVAVVCHSDMERIGWFGCSDPLVERLHENVVWSMRGNFLHIPTDCPQRDERLGWTGDIQVFSPAACFIYDASGFLTSWLRDVALDQDESGAVPFVVPNALGGQVIPAAAWGDAAVIVPWVLYQRYGDAGVLEAQWPSMRAWVDCIKTIAGPARLWNKGFQFGDWLDPAAPPDNPAAARTDPYIVASAYFARSAEIVGLSAQVLGMQDMAEEYLGLASEVREAFNREYVTPNGRVVSDAQTAYSLAIGFALLPTQEQRQHAGERLAELVRAEGYKIGTGFVGTPLICDALCATGHHDVAYRLLMSRECPSWLYPVTMGATTIWERWDSLRPDGSVNPGEMTSFNHYALGAVADWLHRVVGGLAPAEPGYRKLRIQPVPGGGLSYARARHVTPYGTAECSWRTEGGEIEVRVVVPPNTSAQVVLPGSGREVEVGSGEHVWRYAFEAHRYPPVTLDTPLKEILEDAEAWEVLTRHFPEVASMPPRRLERIGTIRDLAASVVAFNERVGRLERELQALSRERS
uniref:alpha-L-rhamnosidase n=1 Tax=Thermomicrobia bacterium PRI-1686 TaxID=260956 RepID=Q6RCI9_9BACT|nr:alpha-L-rhamnosidase A [Thermomicrobia bacterium PRI-1686]